MGQKISELAELTTADLTQLVAVANGASTQKLSLANLIKSYVAQNIFLATVTSQSVAHSSWAHGNYSATRDPQSAFDATYKGWKILSHFSYVRFTHQMYWEYHNTGARQIRLDIWRGGSSASQIYTDRRLASGVSAFSSTTVWYTVGTDILVDDIVRGYHLQSSGGALDLSGYLQMEAV